MADEDEQLDEIMALQSIYEDGTFTCNNSDKPITGSINIPIQTDAEEHSFTCKGDLMPIKHLTPLILNFSLPFNYPSTSPPDVTLSCLWLTSQQLEKLSVKLKEKWAESCSVVLFTWIEFLKTDTFESLGIKFPIDVSEETVMKLKEYSVLREEEIFNRDFHSCPVCFLDKPGMQCVRMPFCDHIFCKECLSGFLTVYIQEGTIHSLVCPSKDCDERVNPHVIKSLVSQSDFERYDRLMLQNTLDVMSDIGYCPRIKCQKPVVVDKNDLMGYCHACNFAFCTRCNMTYHGIDGCMWERDYVQENFRKALKVEQLKSLSSGSDGVEIERELKRFKMRRENLSEQWIGTFTKPCPECGVYINKNDGCNQMTCSRCRCEFCWNCLAKWPTCGGCYRKIDGKLLRKMKNRMRTTHLKISENNSNSSIKKLDGGTLESKLSMLNEILDFYQHS